MQNLKTSLSSLYQKTLNLRLPDQGLVVDCHELKLMIPNPRKSIIGKSIYLTGRWEADVTEFISQKIKPGWTVFDIGSHIGYYTLLFSKLVGNEGSVYAFEPSDDYITLSKNIELNQLDNVKIYDFALFDREGTICMEEKGKTRVKAETSSQDVLVNMKVFDQWKTQEEIKRFDLFKLDVEGAEFNILKGMKQTLQEHKPALLLEVHSDMLPEFGFSALEVADFLQGMGYQIEPVDKDKITFSEGNITLYCQ